MGAFVFFFSYAPVFAAFSFNVASVSATTISSLDQEIQVSLNIVNLPSESYFRVAFQKESGGPYFGYIKNNNGDWSVIQALNGDCTIYYKVSDILTASLELKFKIGEDATIDNGNYRLKAHRFTKTCTSNTEATNYYNFVVNVPTPTPTPTSIPTLTPTLKPEPTLTSTPTPVPTSAPVQSTLPPTLKKPPSPTPTLKPTIVLPSPIVSVTVLGESTKSSRFDKEDKFTFDKSSKNTFSKVLIFLGIIFVGFCAILVFWRVKKNKSLKENE